MPETVEKNRIDNLKAPLLVSWQITRDCDLACLHCCTESAPGKRLSDELDREESMKVVGENGISLDDIWADGPLSYRSVALPHMPNFFMINGPYGPSGSTSVVGLIEVHVDYVMGCLDYVLQHGCAISPCPKRSAALIAEIRARSARTIWATGGCKSWYLDRHGVPLLNPLSLDQLGEEMRHPDFSDFLHHTLPDRQTA